MRRWNPLFLVALLVVVLAAVVFITPPGASAHSFPSTSTNFKGKIVAKNSNSHYFVLSFTCSSSGNTGKWTYEVSSTSSFTGTVEWTSCSFSSSSTGGQVTLNNGTGNLVGCGDSCNINPSPTLTLSLTNIVAAKTFFNAPTSTALCTSPTSQTCLDIEASGFSSIDDFSSQCANFTCIPPDFPFATLNLSAR